MCECTALHILDGTQFLSHPLTILLPYGLHLLLGQLLPHARVIPQIYLGTNDKAWDAGAVVVNLGEPFLADVLEGGGGRDGETDEEDVGLGIGQRTEPIIILLSSRVEQAERVRLIANPTGTISTSAICTKEYREGCEEWRKPALSVCCRASAMSIAHDSGEREGGVAAVRHVHYRDGIVIEYGRDVFGGELVGRIADQQTSLADSTVTDDDASVEIGSRLATGQDRIIMRAATAELGKQIARV